jgi:hypothetical protein
MNPMRSTTLKAKAERIADRARVVGYPDSATIELARNKGATRTNSKRELLATLAEETRLRGRLPAFVSYY